MRSTERKKKTLILYAGTNGFLAKRKKMFFQEFWGVKLIDRSPGNASTTMQISAETGIGNGRV
jgi:hypothetical protein